MVGLIYLNFIFILLKINIFTDIISLKDTPNYQSKSSKEIEKPEELIGKGQTELVENTESTDNQTIGKYLPKSLLQLNYIHKFFNVTHI